MTKLRVNKSKNFCFNCSELNIHVLENPISQRKPLRTGSMGVETHASRQSAWSTAVGPVPRHPDIDIQSTDVNEYQHLPANLIFNVLSIFKRPSAIILYFLHNLKKLSHGEVLHTPFLSIL